MDILMPQLGETVAEGTVAAWHKQAGDRVETDEILLDIETDKVSMEVPSPGTGTLAKILVDTGQTVDVGTLLAVVAVEGESDDAGDTSIVAASAAAAAKPESSDAPANAAPSANASSRAASSRSAAGRSKQLRLSPAVRRLAAEHSIALNSVAGSGRDGRITRRDMLQFLERRGAAPGANTVPFNRIRKLTAEHMVRSKATSPHVLQAVEVDFSGVDRARKAVRESWRARRGYSLTYLPFIAFAVSRALKEFPHANASVEGDALILHENVNLAIAVDLGPEGLVAPVIGRAEQLSVTELAESIHDLAARAREHRLKPDDLAGGTYTLSNSGTFGTLITAPIINQPQVAILSTDGVRKKPVVIEHPGGDSIAIRPVGVLAQSFDHRAIDGAYSAAFLDRVRKQLEFNDWFREL
ncbi:dihydrolipoamide acetyltransferase family protein [Candidatus Rariloculus sp.]|uniref:dihydrolipoamide acetyltransferase family protein n=1 Tax=Candidatus Rariloculus sp. TaxID=3101265 RepID=UPI003D09F4A5